MSTFFIKGIFTCKVFDLQTCSGSWSLSIFILTDNSFIVAVSYAACIVTKPTIANIVIPAKIMLRTCFKMKRFKLSAD